MRPVEVTTHIAADPRRVWDTLTDFPSYPSWTTFIRSVSGRPEVGARLRVTLDLDGHRTTVVHPTVVAATPGERFAWEGRLGPTGLFAGTHEFVLTSLPGGRTRLVHRESFRGAVPALLRRAPRHAERGFEAFSDALARRAEQPPSAPPSPDVGTRADESPGGAA